MTAQHEIEDLTYKITRWKFQSEANWTHPAERAMYISWIEDAQRRITQLEARKS
jgi:hypothetical protein